MTKATSLHRDINLAMSESQLLRLDSGIDLHTIITLLVNNREN